MPLYSNPRRRVSSAYTGSAPAAFPSLQSAKSFSVSALVRFTYPSYSLRCSSICLSEMPVRPRTLE